jgi:hypothetical protein
LVGQFACKIRPFVDEDFPDPSVLRRTIQASANELPRQPRRFDNFRQQLL